MFVHLNENIFFTFQKRKKEDGEYFLILEGVVKIS